MVQAAAIVGALLFLAAKTYIIILTLHPYPGGHYYHLCSGKLAAIVVFL
jgi:hypothetical protein